MLPSERKIPAPRGVGIGHGNRLLLLDSVGRVLVYAPDGKLERHWWMPEYDVGRPEGALQLKDGRIAVADTHYHRVVYFDDRGQVLSMHGKLGRKLGEFIYPVAISQDDKGNVYVAEYGSNDRVQKFDLKGKPLLQFGGFGTDPGQFQRPSGMVWWQGKVYVADAFNNRLQVFDENGKFLKVLVSSESGTSLHYPYSLGCTPEGDLIVVEYGAGRISKFDRAGKLIGRWGKTGSGENELQTPWGLSVDGRGVIYVADTGNGRIVVLEP
jgi:DNA-binding beta-propeller fold protein YncE